MWCLIMKYGLILLALSCANAEQMRYTIESFTVDNKPCMSDCVNGRCRADYGYFYDKTELHACVPGRKPGYQYFTAMRLSNKPRCLSRCVDTGTLHGEWCYVAENLEWDYCSAKTSRDLVTKTLTKSQGPCPCQSQCDKHGQNYSWCAIFIGNCSPKLTWFDYCIDDVQTYIQAWTRKGEQCIGQCDNYGERYTWCKTDNNSLWNFCASPGYLPDKTSTFDRTCLQTCKYEPNHDNSTNCAHAQPSVEDKAVAFEIRKDLKTVQVAERGNAVISYTVKLPEKHTAAYLPVVVRAKITSQTLRLESSTAPPSAVIVNNVERMGMLKGQAENNDIADHLIAQQNGGPEELYNFVPKTISSGAASHPDLNPWSIIGGRIYDWMREDGRSVEQVIVVLYDDWHVHPRPSGFGITVTYYRTDGSIENKCSEYYISNEPVGINITVRNASSILRSCHIGVMLVALIKIMNK